MLSTIQYGEKIPPRLARGHAKCIRHSMYIHMHTISVFLFLIRFAILHLIIYPTAPSIHRSCLTHLTPTTLIHNDPNLTRGNHIKCQHGTPIASTNLRATVHSSLESHIGRGVPVCLHLFQQFKQKRPLAGFAERICLHPTRNKTTILSLSGIARKFGHCSEHIQHVVMSRGEWSLG